MRKTMTDKLKPCPFCGEDNTFIGVNFRGAWLDHHCKRDKDKPSIATTVYGKSKEEVIKMWNRRAEDDR